MFLKWNSERTRYGFILKGCVVLFIVMLLFWVLRDPGKVNNICNVVIGSTPSAVIAEMESASGRKGRGKKV